MGHELLSSMRRWCEASVIERTAVAGAVAGAGFTVEPGWDPPRLRHVRSGLAFVIVPGGVLRMGFSDEEAAHLFSGDYLATAAGDALLREGGVVAVMHLMRSAWPVREVHVGPFLMAVTCVAATSALSSFEGLRLPSESEWEHAVRAGTTTPFYWGDGVPAALMPLPHTLGLELVGWADELVADLWQPDLRDVPLDGRPQLDGALPVVRGGAASGGAWPRTTAPPAAAWRLLCARRRPALGEALWVRPVVSLPACAVLDDVTPRTPSKVRFAPRVRDGLMALHAADPIVRGEARAALRAQVCGPGIWTEQGALTLSALVPLLFDARVPDRAALAVLAADLVCGHHVTVCATGLSDHHVLTAHGPLVRMRECLARARWTDLLASASGPLAAALALLVGVVPELAVPSLDLLARRALEDTDVEVRASMMLACGLGARAAGRVIPVIAAAHEEVPIVRGAASVAQLTYDVRVALDDEGRLLPAQRSALVTFAALATTLPWCEGRMDRLVHAVVCAHVPAGLEHAAELVPWLAA